MKPLALPLLGVALALATVPAPAEAVATPCPTSHVVIDSAVVTSKGGRVLGAARLSAGVDENGYRGFCLDYRATRGHRKWGQFHYWLETHAAYMEGGVGQSLIEGQEPARSPGHIAQYASYVASGDSAVAHVRLVVKEPGRRKVKGVADLSGVGY